MLARTASTLLLLVDASSVRSKSTPRRVRASRFRQRRALSAKRQLATTTIVQLFVRPVSFAARVGSTATKVVNLLKGKYRSDKLVNVPPSEQVARSHGERKMQETPARPSCQQQRQQHHQHQCGNSSGHRTTAAAANSPPLPLLVQQRLSGPAENPAQIVGIGAVERHERVLHAGAPQLFIVHGNRQQTTTSEIETLRQVQGSGSTRGCLNHRTNRIRTRILPKYGSILRTDTRPGPPGNGCEIDSPPCPCRKRKT